MEGYISKGLPNKENILDAIVVNLSIVEEQDGSTDIENIIEGYIKPYLNQLIDLDVKENNANS